jgi:ribosomal protein L37AE/L43A
MTALTELAAICVASERVRRAAAPPKHCSGCQYALPRECFTPSEQVKRSGRCRDCRAAYNRKYYRDVTSLKRQIKRLIAASPKETRA